MPMTHEQRKYAVRRVDGIADEKFKAISTSLKSEKREPLTLEEKLRMIREDEVVLLPEKVVCDRWKEPVISECFMFPSEEGLEAYNEALEARAHERKERVREEARKLRDQIILGSPEDALTLIEKFEAMEF